MNSIKSVIDKYNFRVNSQKEKGNARIINTDKGTFVIKDKKRNDKKEIYKYLKRKQFSFYLDIENEYDDDYEVYPYIENVRVSTEENGLDLIYIMSMLHNKTTFYEKIFLDDTKKFYEEKNNYLDYIKDYYDTLLNNIESTNFIPPSNYLLLRNISYIYTSIENSKEYLKMWYEIVKNKESRRVAMTHNNIDSSHLLSSEANYLISWDLAKIDNPIYDFYNFYKKNYKQYDFKKLYAIYNAKYELLEEEKYLLYALLLLPNRLEFKNSEIENTKECYNYLNYLHYTLDFISKYNSEYSNAQ